MLFTRLKRLRNKWKDKSGSELIEFTLILPTFILMIFAYFDVMMSLSAQTEMGYYRQLALVEVATRRQGSGSGDKKAAELANEKYTGSVTFGNLMQPDNEGVFSQPLSSGRYFVQRSSTATAGLPICIEGKAKIQNSFAWDDGGEGIPITNVTCIVREVDS